MKRLNSITLSLLTLLSLGASAHAAGFDPGSVQCVQKISEASCETDNTVGGNGCFNSLVCKSAVSYKGTDGIEHTYTFTGTACYYTELSPTSVALTDLDTKMGKVRDLPICN